MRAAAPADRAFARLGVVVARRAAWVVAFYGVVCAVCALWAAGSIGVDTDTSGMLADDLAWRQHQRALEEAFPGEGDAILVVIDAPALEGGAARAAMDEAAGRVAAALRARADVVERIEQPGSDPFLARNGLLYAPAERAEAAAESVEQAAPMVRLLASDPSLAAFSDLLGVVVTRGTPEQRARGDALFGEFAATIAGARSGVERPFDWNSVFDGARSGRAAHPAEGSVRVLVVRPIRDGSRTFPLGPAVRACREAVGALPGGGARVRLTGGPVLSMNELETAASGATVSAAVAFALVGLVLWIGLASARLVLAAMVTLAAGLAITTAFAVLAFGDLNLISVAFAVLYIGLGIDYAIHTALRSREATTNGARLGTAVVRSTRDVGPALAICAITTSVGFLAFVPTDFRGIAELGVIASVGMFVSLAVSVTLLPALMALGGVPRRHGRRERAAGGGGVRAHRWGVRAGAAAVAIAAALLAPGARFDTNRLNLMDADAEPVRAFRDLLADPGAGVMSASVIRGDRAAALEVARSLEALPSVSRALTLADLIPPDQDRKLESAARALAALPGDIAPVPPDPERDRGGLEALRASLEARASAGPSPGADVLLRELGAFLGGSPADAEVDRVARATMGGFGAAVDAVRARFELERITPGSLPEGLRSRWITPDGRWRVRAIPAEDLSGDAALVRFVDGVRSVATDATGEPVTGVLAGRTMARAFGRAFAIAAVVVFVLVAVLLRDAVDAALVMVPLMLASLVTAAVTAALDLPLNFANVIALPLILGVGVDNGVHVVHRARRLAEGRDVLGSSTGRAVLFSLVTTLVSFGSLGFSAHPGMASMGVLLAVGVGLTLLSTLVLLPAMLPERELTGHGR